jgi:transposase
MRGQDAQPQQMFSYVKLEDRIPTEHPLREVRQLVDVLLKQMSKDFDKLYARTGRPSIAPERLLRAQLLQIFYSIRSERMLMEQLEYNLLFRWFVGLEIDEAVWNHSVFAKNRDRLLNEEVAQEFFARVREAAESHMSDEHFTVDGTLIEAWAGQNSFRPKDDDPDGGKPGGGEDFRGQQRKNDTHESTTDPDSRLYRKSNGKEAKLSFLGHIVVENRNGLIAAALTTQADGTAEKEAGILLTQEIAGRVGHRITMGADRAYDIKEFVATVRELNCTPHVMQNTTNRRSAIDGRTTRHEGYRISRQKRWLVEKPFGWLKTTGPLRKVKLRGLPKVSWLFVFSCAACNLWRLPKLMRSECAA